ncbi:hypothetical protein XELAEV_18019149mg [Xenopus laevis]|uniref:SEA domain-containing protein n=1 Tax=Xenopus laevis TaxID=8355 RepID=A0A974DED9_XENLA|nr:hypothetical protein XELAEV_18019149mg [Xenopus laevis]
MGTMKWTLALLILICGVTDPITSQSPSPSNTTTTNENSTTTPVPPSPSDNTTNENSTTTPAPPSPSDNTTNENSTTTPAPPSPDNTTNENSMTTPAPPSPSDNTTNENSTTTPVSPSPSDNTTNENSTTTPVPPSPSDNTTNENSTTTPAPPSPSDNTTNENSTTTPVSPSPSDNTTNENSTATPVSPSPSDNTTNENNNTTNENSTTTPVSPSPDNTTNENSTTTPAPPSPSDNTTNENNTTTPVSPSPDNTTNENSTTTPAPPSPDNTTNENSTTTPAPPSPSDNTTNENNTTTPVSPSPSEMTTSNQYSTTITVSPLPPGKVTTIPNSIATTKALSTSNTYSISPSTVTTAGSCAYGYLSGSNCVCKENFHGSKCDLISNEVRPGEGPVVVKVKVTIVVVNVKYSSELSDKKSSEYIDFEKRFKEEVLKQFIYVTAIVRLQGSVVVEHEVLTNVSLTNGNEQYYKAVRDINNTLSRTNSTPGETVKNTSKFDPRIEILRLRISKSKDLALILRSIDRRIFRSIERLNPSNRTIRTILIQRSKENPSIKKSKFQANYIDHCSCSLGLCSEVDFIPEDMRQYFYGVNESNRLLCVSNCSSFNPEFVNCNEGQCSISKTGPHCYCKTSGEFWYTGDRCENSVSKAGVIAGVTIGLAVLLLIFIVVVVKLIRRRGKTGKETLVDNEHHWYNAWEGENFEKGQNRNSASNSNNGSQSSNSGNREFRPALHKVNTDVKIRTGRAKVTH